MNLPTLARIAAALLGAAGLFNLAPIVRRRLSPAEMRGCILAGAACLLLGGALWAQTSDRGGAALAIGAGGAICGLSWLRHIYLQSLHNTAM